MGLVVVPATGDLWPALEKLFGRGGASNGCWCMYWLLGPRYHRRDRSLNRDALRASLDAQPPPGLLALVESADPATDAALGWVRLTPRSELDWLNRTSFLAPVDDFPVWSIACLYVRARYRRSGVADALVRAAVDAALAAAAPAVEAYPVDASVPGATRNAFTGYLESFERAGFVEVARRRPSRPIVRVTLPHRPLAS